MALFEVPGWSVPSAPVTQVSKKRKRPTTKASTDDVDDVERMHSAQKNFDKLMRTLGAGMVALEADSEVLPVKKKREGKEKKANGAERVQEQDAGRGRKANKEKKKAGSRPSNSKERQTKDSKKIDGAALDKLSPSPAKSKKQKQKKKRALSVDARFDADSAHDDITGPPVMPVSKDGAQTPGKKANIGKDKQTQEGLTALQAKMKNSLDGARFRWINEMLYKSDSKKAHELMSQDPAVFADYHTGFRHQVESWPTNPVSHYISTLSSYPAKTVIADLGCGDAALARALVPKGMSVLSFDLRSDDAYVIEADICSRIPLPGSEPSAEGEGEAQVVDVVVCALSLMGTNWPVCIREAWRILRPEGELKIAEVTSRFASVNDFTSFVASFGFKLKSKDERNTHFALFEFKKVPRKPKVEKDWEKLLSRGGILKPCEYKRR
ncbi:methyltransferase-domain-containing protein [Dichomitus squalens]|uniref:Ribosomal RNA-processing protein 8 n=1 Tax=Dichomitus squalens TaxID=114155 RepID=A0A4Q9Q964_9APHY|nr:methyltransferase-domain-containing protein [Dichomitus squalens]TBU64147.1 methyltransferase-domain-containing protein [Dichomitus squalens]